MFEKCFIENFSGLINTVRIRLNKYPRVCYTMGKCHFKNEWLSKKDQHGYAVKEWARKFDDLNAFCMICNKTFSITKGYSKIEQHADGQHHKNASAQVLSDRQLRLAGLPPSNDNSILMPSAPGDSQPQLFSVRDGSTKNELRWVIKFLVSDYPAASCEGISDLFLEMFGESAVKDFSLSRTKFRYLTIDT